MNRQTDMHGLNTCRQTDTFLDTRSFKVLDISSLRRARIAAIMGFEKHKIFDDDDGQSQNKIFIKFEAVNNHRKR